MDMASADNGSEVREGCRDENDAEKGPASVDRPDGHVLLLIEADLVRQFQEMRAAWDQRERGRNDGREGENSREHGVLH